jgi:hypothetical protein
LKRKEVMILTEDRKGRYLGGWRGRGAWPIELFEGAWLPGLRDVENTKIEKIVGMDKVYYRLAMAVARRPATRHSLWSRKSSQNQARIKTQRHEDGDLRVELESISQAKHTE